MGISTSSLLSGGLASNDHVLRIASMEHIDGAHPFWNDALSFRAKTPRCIAQWRDLDSELAEVCKRFCTNNIRSSGNFGTLIDIFMVKQKELKSAVETNSSTFIWQTFNCLFMIRVCLKYFMEHLKEDEVHRQFEAAPKAAAAKQNEANDEEASVAATHRMEDFAEALCRIVVDLPVNDLTYGLQSESVSSLILLLSGPLFSTKPAFQMRAFRIIMASKQATSLMRALMNNFAEQKLAPAAYISDEGGSLVLGLASGVWNVLTLGYSSVATQPVSGDEVVATKPLADASLQLMLILTNHCTDCAGSLTNPYKELLCSCSHLSDTDDEAAERASSVEAASFSTDFNVLFKTLCATLATDESTLLLYLLLHQNGAFRTHVVASSEMECLVLPLLRTLYHAPTSSNHHIYMSLIVLLILSEDDLFNTSVHDITLRNIDWYTERALSEISLGGLLILVVIRTIQYNMLKMRDKYLHTNCLAALANMSSQFRNMHPYVSQRIVSMFEALARKHSRLVETLQNSGDLEDAAGDEDSPLCEALADVSVLEEVLRMILEIVNSTLVHQIKNNSNLIYTLLYKRELFEPYITHPAFQDLAQNLQTVITYFNHRLEQSEVKKERTLSVNEVQDVIRHTAMQFPREKLTKFPDLKFKYVEEEQPEDFFVPYIWTLATQKIYWNPSQIKLFPRPNT